MLLFTFLLVKPLAAQSIPYEVCVESATWVRPSPEVQSKVWNDARYSDFARDAYAWTHNFLFIDDPMSASVTGTFSSLSGLWTAASEWRDKCYGTRRSGFDWIEVWSLLHRVKEVRRDANTYTLTVEQVAKGFQWIFIPRMNPSMVLRFVTPDGKELERWDEAAPPRQFTNTVPPGTVIAPTILRK